jgi:AraC-like DNA-binding protein
MTLFTQIDLMARGASIALFLLWSCVLLRDHRSSLAARIAVAMNFAIVAYLLATSHNMPRNLFGLLLAIISGSAPGLFWLLARTWFSDRNAVGRWPIVIIVVALVNIVIMQLSFGRMADINLVCGTLFHVTMFAFALAGLWETWRSWDGDLVEVRRTMRPFILIAVGIYVIIIAISEVAVFDFGAPRWIARTIGMSIVVVTLPFVIAMMGMRRQDLFGAPANAIDAPAAPAAPVDDRLADQLTQHMRIQLPHRDGDLTIAKLARQLGEQEYRLRRHINGGLGHRNFAAFLNGYRLAEVKAALVDPAQREVPIITIALDAGFGSLGPFNRAFREAEGMTPSEFRTRALAVSETG